MKRSKIKEVMESLNEIYKDNKNNYREVEIGFLLFLRSDIDEFDDITNKQLTQIDSLIDNQTSLLDIDREDIDAILYGNYDDDEYDVCGFDKETELERLHKGE